MTKQDSRQLFVNYSGYSEPEEEATSHVAVFLLARRTTQFVKQMIQALS